MPRPHSQHHRRATRRRPSLAGTLTAAVLVGELAVVTLVGAEAAHAQADETSARGDGIRRRSESTQRGEPGATDVVPESPPVDTPDLPDVPDVPDVPDAPAAAPDVPGLPPAPAALPIRTGHDAGAAPLAVPRTARADDPDHDADAAIRSGDADADQFEPESSPRGPVHDTPAPLPAPRPRAPQVATEARRARRGVPPRPVTGASAAAGALPATHTIAPGEHLWGIAAARVATLTGRDAATIPAEEVAPYWTRLCMANEARLRSGIPSLVYPGEVIEMPPA